ncbi:MAG: type II toxin-antitoxin system YafQ family toxin [Clostridiales bacterium]|jgi:mRNA interferase YafQ|nr:type II toxin-antitoxin system YafQ family toxin [Clostridiales bacterium]
MLNIEYTNIFEKDLKKIAKQGRDIDFLKSIIQIIANETALDKKHQEHLLKGEYENCSECHIKPDWLLIYYIENETLVLLRTGSHSELFK